MLLPKRHLVVSVVIAFTMMPMPSDASATRRQESSLLQNAAKSGLDHVATLKSKEPPGTFDTSSTNDKWRYAHDDKLDPSTNETGSEDKDNCTLITITNLTLSAEVAMIHASWSADANNPCLIGFTVTWRSLVGDVANCRVEKDDRDTTRCSGNQLTECIQYEVLVQVITTNDGDHGEKKVSSTAFTQPERPEAPENLSCSRLNSAVKVSWTTPLSGNCPVNMYHITWSHDIPWLRDTLYNSAITLETSYLLQTTIPLTNYTVTVAAIMPGNVIGKTDSCRFLTSEGASSMTVNHDSSGDDRSLNGRGDDRPLNGRPFERSLGNLGSSMKSVDSNQDPNMATEIIGVLKGGVVYNISVYSARGGGGEENCTDMVDVKVLYGVLLAVLLLVMVGLVFSKRRDIQQKTSMNQIRTSKDQRAFYSSSFKTLNQKIHDLVSRPGSLTAEFEALEEKSPKASCVIASLQCNKKKNRFINILPFDNHRVVLTDDMTDGNDYINASFVSCPVDKSLVFVAAQTPKENTIVDFWRMIWNLSAGIIVTLVEAVEEHKIKSDQYWPLSDDQPLEVNQFKVELLNEKKKKTHFARNFRLIRGNEEKEVKQLHFSDWTNFNVPNSHIELLEFLKLVREQVQKTKKVHLVVHCLAGVGRTGTFIGLWNLILKAEQREQVDVEATILEMRKHRSDLLQTKEQYFFLLECYAKYLNTPKFWNNGQKHSAAVSNAISETQQWPFDSPQHTTLQQYISMPNQQQPIDSSQHTTLQQYISMPNQQQPIDSPQHTTLQQYNSIPNQQQSIDSPQHKTFQKINSMPNHLGNRQPSNSQFNGNYLSGTNMSTSSAKGIPGDRQNHEYPANILQRQGTDMNSSSLKGKSGYPQNHVEHPTNNLQGQGTPLNNTSLIGNTGYSQNESREQLRKSPTGKSPSSSLSRQGVRHSRISTASNQNTAPQLSQKRSSPPHEQ